MRFLRSSTGTRVRRPRGDLRAPFATRYVLAVVAALSVGQAAPAAGSDYFVSPNGLATNDGSEQHPIDLDTALSASGPVRPGDTVWLRGGVYQRAAVEDSEGNIVLYVSTLNGTADAPIVVRQYPGERATLDGVLAPAVPVLVVNGNYSWFWGFEITNSHPDRSSGRGAGLDSYGRHNRFINLIIHDTGAGVGFWQTGQLDDSEVHGAVISHVGWEGSERGHGHSIYVQNVNGSKRMTDNILFDGFSFGIHAYTENGRIDNLEMRRNIVFNHGNLSATGGAKANLLIAGRQVAQFPAITDNFAYYPSGSPGRNLDVSICNHGTIQNNYLAGGTPLKVYCINTVVTGNTLYGPVAAPIQATYPDNSYGTTPSGVFVGVRPNAYESGRANVVIYNWSHLPAVSVDLTAAGLVVGDTYEVRDAQNYFGPAVLSGVYDGTALFPMAGLPAAPVLGDAPIQPGHTSAEFGAFVVRRLTATGVPRPIATMTASPAVISSDEPSTLSWWTSGAASVTIDQGIGAVAPSSFQPIAPATSVTYSLTATNVGGSTGATAVVMVRPPASADGTVVPPALHIVDRLGVVWTMSGNMILRNGVSAAGATGDTILWSDGTIYSRGDDGVTWREWSGTAWSSIGTTPPVAPPPPPPPLPPTTSPDGTMAPPATQLVDASGAVWAISTDVVLRNGAPAAGASGLKLLWFGGAIYVLGSDGSTWWGWNGLGWTDVGTTQPGVTPPPVTSADGTAVPPASQIVDALGGVWTMNGAVILRNGAPAAGGTGVKILWSGGSIYVLGATGGNWWRWTGAGWSGVGPAQPGGPPPHTGPTAAVQSFALNGYKRVLDGQWQGIRYASDGNVYFGSSTHSAHHGAAFFKFDPRTDQVTLLADDITIIAGEDPQTNPQGKLHSDIVEANGWLYMSTHFSSEGPGASPTMERLARHRLRTGDWCVPRLRRRAPELHLLFRDRCRSGAQLPVRLRDR